MYNDKLVEKVHDALLPYIRNNSSIIISISGGIDSIVLLDILNKFQQIYKLNISLMHVNYNMHRNSIKSEKLCISLSEKYKYPIELKSVKLSKNNFESNARNFRYKHLNEFSDSKNINFIFTAHHLNDQIETLYMKKITKCDWLGYLGIRYKYGKIIRPMLGITKKEIIKYANKNGLKWIEDLSNQDITILRNKIRLKILPELLIRNPSLATQLLNKNKNSIKKFSHLKEDIKKYVKEYVLENASQYIIISNNITKLDDLVKFKVFYKNIISIKLKIANNHDFSNKYWKELYNFISTSSTGSKFYIGEKLSIIKGREKHYLFKNKFISKKKSYKLKFDSINNWYNTKIILNKNLLSNRTILHSMLVSYNNLESGINIRNWQPGDTIYSQFYNSKIKVKKIFINNKVSRFNKSIFPVLTDSNNTIICLPGLFNKDDNNKNNIRIYWTL